MALPISVTYVSGTTPAIDAPWLNGVDSWVNGSYAVLGATYTAAAFRTALGVTATGVDTTYCYRANNLSDLANITTARTTLGAAASGLATASGITLNTGKLLGRTTAAVGAIEEITVGTGLTLSAGTLSASGGGIGTGGQTWQNLVGSRALGGAGYTNGTSLPIMISVSAYSSSGTAVPMTLNINGTGAINMMSSANNSAANLTAIVPVGATYVVSLSSGILQAWAELR